MRGSSWKTLSTVALLAAAPLAIACQGGEQGEQEMGGAEQPAQQEEQEAMGTTTTVELSPVEDATVSGEVYFERQGNSLTVDISAQMGSPGDYPSHIHEGTCADFGGVAVPLNAGVAEEPGIAEATTTVDATQLDPTGSYLVMVHTQQGAPAACAQIPPSVLQGGGG